MRRVVITGVGIVSSIGNDATEVLQSLRSGTSGIELCPEYQDMGLTSHIHGSLNIDTTALVDKRARRFMGDGAAYAHIAMQQAIEDAGLPEDLVSNERTGLIAGSGGPSTEHIVLAADTLRNKGLRRVGPFAVPKSMSSTISAGLATPFKIQGLNYSITSACATSAHCIGNAAELIQNGKQEIVFAGGGEELHWSLTHLFDAMKALSTKFNETPESASRPFDSARDGFVISGGGGILVLEELEHATKRGAKVYAELAGYGATSDGFDMVQPSGSGAVRCMKQALGETSVDYVNVHGTSTPLGDVVELKALKEVFGADVPAFSSTKSLTGHSLGAAGVHEAIYTLLMMQHGFASASANVTDLDAKPRACRWCGKRRTCRSSARCRTASASAAPMPAWCLHSSSELRAPPRRRPTRQPAAARRRSPARRTTLPRLGREDFAGDEFSHDIEERLRDLRIGVAIVVEHAIGIGVEHDGEEEAPAGAEVFDIGVLGREAVGPANLVIDAQVLGGHDTPDTAQHELAGVVRRDRRIVAWIDRLARQLPKGLHDEGTLIDRQFGEAALAGVDLGPHHLDEHVLQIRQENGVFSRRTTSARRRACRPPSSRCPTAGRETRRCERNARIAPGQQHVADAHRARLTILAQRMRLAEPVPQPRARKAAGPHRTVDAILADDLKTMIVGMVVADQEQLPERVTQRQSTVDQVARVGVDAHVAVEARLDHEFAVETERGPVHAVCAFRCRSAAIAPHSLIELAG